MCCHATILDITSGNERYGFHSFSFSPLLELHTPRVLTDSVIPRPCWIKSHWALGPNIKKSSRRRQMMMMIRRDPGQGQSHTNDTLLESKTHHQPPTARKNRARVLRRKVLVSSRSRNSVVAIWRAARSGLCVMTGRRPRRIALIR